MELDPNAKVSLALLAAMGGVVAGYRLRGAPSQVLMVAGLALAQWLASSAQEDVRRRERTLSR